MKRQTLYIVILSVVLLASVILFSIFFLIPKGKEYRGLRLESKKELQELELTQHRFDQTQERLKELHTRHKETISAFHNHFNPERFEKLYKKEFTDLYLTEVTTFETNGSFTVYEVNATSKITSPESFYTFVESVNHSKWIIGVNFPIHFERDGDKIRSSFTMKVHNASLDKIKSEASEQKEKKHTDSKETKGEGGAKKEEHTPQEHADTAHH